MIKIKKVQHGKQIQSEIVCPLKLTKNNFESIWEPMSLMWDVFLPSLLNCGTGQDDGQDFGLGPDIKPQPKEKKS